MEPLIVEKTETTPSIEFNPETGNFCVKGESRPENAFEFFEPVLEWFNKFAIERKPEKIDLDLYIDYLNTISAKYITQLLFKFTNLEKDKIKVGINWYYKKYDQQALEDGEDISFAINRDFNFIEIRDDGG